MFLKRTSKFASSDQSSFSVLHFWITKSTPTWDFIISTEVPLTLIHFLCLILYHQQGSWINPHYTIFQGIHRSAAVTKTCCIAEHLPCHCPRFWSRWKLQFSTRFGRREQEQHSTSLLPFLPQCTSTFVVLASHFYHVDHNSSPIFSRKDEISIHVLENILGEPI